MVETKMVQRQPPAHSWFISFAIVVFVLTPDVLLTSIPRLRDIRSFRRLGLFPWNNKNILPRIAVYQPREDLVGASTSAVSTSKSEVGGTRFLSDWDGANIYSIDEYFSSLEHAQDFPYGDGLREREGLPRHPPSTRPGNTVQNWSIHSLATSSRYNTSHAQAVDASHKIANGTITDGPSRKANESSPQNPGESLQEPQDAPAVNSSIPEVRLADPFPIPPSFVPPFQHPARRPPAGLPILPSHPTHPLLRSRSSIKPYITSTEEYVDLIPKKTQYSSSKQSTLSSLFYGTNLGTRYGRAIREVSPGPFPVATEPSIPPKDHFAPVFAGYPGSLPGEPSYVLGSSPQGVGTSDSYEVQYLPVVISAHSTPATSASMDSQIIYQTPHVISPYVTGFIDASSPVSQLYQPRVQSTSSTYYQQRYYYSPAPAGSAATFTPMALTAPQFPMPDMLDTTLSLESPLAPPPPTFPMPDLPSERPTSSPSPQITGPSLPSSGITTGEHGSRSHRNGAGHEWGGRSSRSCRSRGSHGSRHGGLFLRL